MMWCEERDLNPHVLSTLTPEASASTNSATFALCKLRYYLNILAEQDILLTIMCIPVVRREGLEPSRPKDTNT